MKHAGWLAVLALVASTATAQFSTRSRGARITPVDEADRDCTVHVLSSGSEGPESQYRCGEWFEPEPGTLILWLEGRDRISPMDVMVVAPSPPAMNELVTTLPMVDAATIAVDPQEFPLDGFVRMVSLSHGNVAFERWVSSLEQAADGVLTPAGLQILATFGPDSCARSLAPIVDLKAGQRYQFAAAPLGDRGAILAMFDQPSRGATRDAVVTLRRDGVEFPPNVVKIVTDRIDAVWSSIPPGDYTITVSGMTLDNERAIVERGAVATVRASLTPAPESEGRN